MSDWAWPGVQRAQLPQNPRRNAQRVGPVVHGPLPEAPAGGRGTENPRNSVVRGPARRGEEVRDSSRHRGVPRGARTALAPQSSVIQSVEKSELEHFSHLEEKNDPMSSLHMSRPLEDHHPHPVGQKTHMLQAHQRHTCQVSSRVTAHRHICGCRAAGGARCQVVGTR